MRMGARVLLVAWLGVIFAITLSPHNNGTQRSGNEAVSVAKEVRKQIDLPSAGLPANIRNRETDLIGNVLLFIPLGFLAVIAFPTHRKAIAVTGPLLSGSIETFQMGYLPHRTASLSDVATNSTGHFLGMAAALVLAALVAHRQQSSA